MTGYDDKSFRTPMHVAAVGALTESYGRSEPKPESFEVKVHLKVRRLLCSPIATLSKPGLLAARTLPGDLSPRMQDEHELKPKNGP